MKIILGIILGILAVRLIRRAWNAFQLREIQILSGTLPLKKIDCQPGKWGKRFKYVHNFLVETRFHLFLQKLYLKKDLLHFCLKHNVFNFKASLLGKCLQARVDAETAVIGEPCVFFHIPFSVEFKNYLHSLTHPDPVVYGLQRVGKGEGVSRPADLEDGGD